MNNKLRGISDEKVADLWQQQSNLWVRIFLTLPVLFGVVIGAWWTTYTSSYYVGKAILFGGFVAHIVMYLLLQRVTEYVNAFRDHLENRLPTPKEHGIKGHQIARAVPIILSLILLVMFLFAS